MQRDGSGDTSPINKILLLINQAIRWIAYYSRPGTMARMGDCIPVRRFCRGEDGIKRIEWAEQSIKRVSAIVPNYNYARYIKQRLSTIVAQTYPLLEVIVLDDASTDNSVEVIRDTLSSVDGIPHRFFYNDRNSGSVFEQWKKGIELAQGEYVWICEADDLADAGFLEQIMTRFEDENVVMAYSQSRQINSEGQEVMPDYLSYTDYSSRSKWLRNYCNDGKDELAGALAIQNTIPNASAVVFRKKELVETLGQCWEDLKKLHIAGDWLLYSELLKKGNISFIAESLNCHRRHENSVSGAKNALQMAEFLYMQNRIADFVPLHRTTKKKAKKFAGIVHRHLRLDPWYAQDPAKHPEVEKIYERLTNKSSEVRKPDAGSAGLIPV